MKSFLVVCTALAVSSCATSTKTPLDNHTGRILCMEVLEAGEVILDCLDSLTADSTEVEQRVEVYNYGKDKDRAIRCDQREATGSKISRWRCTRTNRSGDPINDGIAVIDLIGTERFRNRPR